MFKNEYFHIYKPAPQKPMLVPLYSQVILISRLISLHTDSHPAHSDFLSLGEDGQKRKRAIASLIPQGLPDSSSAQQEHRRCKDATNLTGWKQYHECSTRINQA